MHKTIIAYPYSVVRSIPKGDKKYLPAFESDLSYYQKNISYLYKFKNSYITHYGPVMPGMSFAPTLTSQMREKPIYLIKLYLSCIKKIITNKVVKNNLKCIVVHNNYVNNYYHWVLEVFFRLYLIRDHLSTHALVLPKISFGFQKEMLSLLKVEVEQTIQIEPENLIKADEVIVPQYPADYGNYEPLLLKEYANWILSKTIYLINPNISKRKIYISRKNAQYRRVINEDILVGKLEKFNFDIIQLENLSFLEQVILFQNAEIIVAPHGAGLTNLIYCKPQTVLIELFPEGYIHPCFYTLADVFNINYFYLIGKDIRNSPSLKPYQYDMEIELGALENMLNQIITPSQIDI